MKYLPAWMTVAIGLSACGGDKPLPAYAFGECDGSVGFQNLRPATCATSKAPGMSMVIGATVRGTDLVAQLANFEVGTTIASGTHKGDRSALVTVPIGDKIKTIKLEHLKGTPMELGIDLVVDSPRHAPATLKLPPMNVAAAFQDTKVAEQILVTEKLGAGAAAPAKHSVYFAYRAYVVGEPASLADIDWVALPTSKGMDESEKCHYETDKGQSVDIAKTVEVFSVKLVDRYTGKEIETREFRPLGKCPEFTSAHSIRIEFDYESWKAVETWLTEKMTAG